MTAVLFFFFFNALIGNLDTETCRQGEHHVKTGVMLAQTEGLPEAGERSGTDPSLVPSEGAWSC